MWHRAGTNQVSIKSVNRVAVHSLLCILRAAPSQHACTTKEVFILRVHSLYLSLLSPILPSAYPLISHRTKYTYGWFRTVKSHALLVAHPNLTSNDGNRETGLAQVDEELPSSLPSLHFSFPLPCFAGADFPISLFDLVWNLSTQLPVPLPLSVCSFCLSR